MGLQPLTTQQAPRQMPVDVAQPSHTHLLPKLMEHSSGWINAAQPGESPPSRLFRQLG